MQDIQNRAVIIDSFLPTLQVFLGGGAVDEDLRFDALAAQPNLLVHVEEAAQVEHAVSFTETLLTEMPMESA